MSTDSPTTTDPTLEHETPLALARDRTLSLGERLRRLKQWRDLVHQQIRAAGEGMAGPADVSLPEIESALRTLRRPTTGDAMSTKTLDTLNDRIRAYGSRIEALDASGAMPGSGAPGGYSAKIASLRHHHKAARANLVRLTSTPKSEQDWERLHDRLAAELDTMDGELVRLESPTERPTP